VLTPHPPCGCYAFLLAKMPGSKVIKHAQAHRHVTASSSLLHGWDNKGNAIPFTLNVLNLGSFGLEIREWRAGCFAGRQRGGTQSLTIPARGNAIRGRGPRQTTGFKSSLVIVSTTFHDSSSTWISERP